MIDDRFIATRQHNLIPNLSLRYAGKLLLRNEIHINDDLLNQLLHKNYFQTINSMITKRFTSECSRCGNDKKHLIGEIPCYLCKKTHAYCRKCIEMGRVSACEPLYIWKGEHPKWKQHENPCSWNGELTNAQQIAANRIIDAINMKEKELLIWAV